MTKSEIGRANAMKRWVGHDGPVGTPYAKQSSEERRLYKNLMQRRRRAEFRSAGESRHNVLKSAITVDIASAMRLWR